LAKYYDLFYESKDYAKEAKILSRLIDHYKRSSGRRLLDVGCGTGKHIQSLRKKFDCVGLDVSEQMLEIARRNVKGVEFARGDMVNFDLGRRFDIILCLFSGIGYVRTYSNLARTLKCFARHLVEGGAVIIEPWFTKSSWKVGSVHMRAYDSKDLKVVRVDFSGIREGRSTVDERLLVAEKDRGVSYYRDGQVMGLFEVDKFLNLMKKAGLRAKFLRKTPLGDRGLYVGVKDVEFPHGGHL
jgi:ubiquinone/menaquinone biosynthesis C-methylase UbiE